MNLYQLNPFVTLCRFNTVSDKQSGGYDSREQLQWHDVTTDYNFAQTTKKYLEKPSPLPHASTAFQEFHFQFVPTEGLKIVLIETWRV